LWGSNLKEPRPESGRVPAGPLASAPGKRNYRFTPGPVGRLGYFQRDSNFAFRSEGVRGGGGAIAGRLNY